MSLSVTHMHLSHSTHSLLNVKIETNHLCLFLWGNYDFIIFNAVYVELIINIKMRSTQELLKNQITLSILHFHL